MQPKIAIISLLGFLCVITTLWFFLFTDSAAPVATWSEQDESVVDDEVTELSGEGVDVDTRTEVEFAVDAARDPDSSVRPLVTIRGRVVTADGEPVAQARVALTAQSRGRRALISKQVITENDGTFAFRGKGFTRLWVTLHVTHRDYALATAFKGFDAAKGQLDVGDIKVVVGGSIVGSITDMQGNVVPSATAHVTPDSGRLRWQRGQRKLFPAVQADQQGVFRIAHIAPGSYRISATAPHRQRFSDGPITIVDQRQERLDPIRLGPGFELEGSVFKPDGAPLAKADVSVRAKVKRGRGREHGRKTNRLGKFTIDHLPPGRYTVTVRSKGYLTHTVSAVEVTTAPPQMIHMEPGLRITGRVVDAVTSAPVLRFGNRIHRVGNLLDPIREKRYELARKLLDTTKKLRKLNAEKPSKATAKQLQQTQAKLRGLKLDGDESRRLRGTSRDHRRSRGRPAAHAGHSLGANRGGNPRSWRARFNPGRPGSAGEVLEHDNGEFAFTGLEEGFYVIDIGSPNHQLLRSERIELRRGIGAPHATLVLHRGLAVSGLVISKLDAQPVPRANVELRLVEPVAIRPTTPEAKRRDQFRNLMQRLGGSSAGPRTTRLLSARTDATGTFEITQAPRGRYVLRASAEGFTTTTSAVFDLDKDRPGVELPVGKLGAIEGRVTGATGKELAEVRVMAFALPAAPRNMQNVAVNSDGTYRITGLQPGGYIVRAFRGNARGFIFRELFRSAQTNPTGERIVDIELDEGQVRRFNVGITEHPTGTVGGRVMVNGAGAQGYRVSLRKIEPTPAPESPLSLLRHFSRGRQGTVDQHGRYRIVGVDAGDYDILVARGGGGRGGSNTIAKGRVSVTARIENSAPTVAINLGALQGQISLPADEETAKPAKFGGRVTLYKGVVAVPEPSTASQSVIQFSTRIRNSKFEIGDIPSGEYLLCLRLGGRQPLTQQIYVGSGENVKLELTAGALRKPTPKPQAPGGTSPGNTGKSGPTGKNPR